MLLLAHLVDALPLRRANRMFNSFRELLNVQYFCCGLWQGHRTSNPVKSVRITLAIHALLVKWLSHRSLKPEFRVRSPDGATYMLARASG